MRRKVNDMIGTLGGNFRLIIYSTPIEGAEQLSLEVYRAGESQLFRSDKQRQQLGKKNYRKKGTIYWITGIIIQ